MGGPGGGRDQRPLNNGRSGGPAMVVAGRHVHAGGSAVPMEELLVEELLADYGLDEVTLNLTLDWLDAHPAAAPG